MKKSPRLTVILSSIIVSSIIPLSSCAPAARDYESSAHCADLGLKAGTPEFETCVSNQRKERMLEQQRREYDERKQYEEDWRNRRF
jgi:hypothetical protein